MFSFPLWLLFHNKQYPISHNLFGSVDVDAPTPLLPNAKAIIIILLSHTIISPYINNHELLYNIFYKIAFLQTKKILTYTYNG